MAPDYDLDDDEADEAMRASAGALLETEDGPIVRNIQQSLGNADFFAQKPVLLPADEALVRVRRTLTKLIAEEQVAGVYQAEVAA